MKIKTLLPFIFLTGCASLPNNIAPGYVDTFKTVKGFIVGYPDNIVTSDLIRNIPYASMSLKIGKGPRGLVILESINEKELTWVTADPIYLVTKHGRIIKTEGLDNDLVETLYPKINFEQIFADNNTNLNAYYSYENPSLFNLELVLNYTLDSPEQVKILDKTMELSKITETVNNKFLGWKFSNFYWVDEDFFVWKSEQIINPKLPIFKIEVTKKPSY